MELSTEPAVERCLVCHGTRCVIQIQEIRMNKLVIAAIATAFAANVALATTPAAPAKVESKKTEAAAPAPAAAPATPAAGDSCEAKAVSKAGKPLAGAAKAAFMKKCEKENPAAETKAGGTSQQEKMKTCNKEATGKKGDERKKFMSACLKK